MREWLATWLVALGACLLAVPSLGSAASAVVAKGTSLQIQMLDPAQGDAGIEKLSSGALDAHLQPFDFSAARKGDDAFGRDCAPKKIPPRSVPTLNISKGRHLQIQAYTVDNSRTVPLRTATHLPGFRGMHQMVLALPDQLVEGQMLYVRVDPQGQGWEGLHSSAS